MHSTRATVSLADNILRPSRANKEYLPRNHATPDNKLHPTYDGISDILGGLSCPEPKLVRPRTSSIRSRPSRAVTRSQAADKTDTGETPPDETAESVQSDAGVLPRTPYN